MGLLRRVFEWFNNLLPRGNKPFKVVTIEDIPEMHKKGVIYIVGEDSPWYVTMICPCGCNEVIRLCLLSEVSPSWKLIQHSSDGSVSLQPSVWRTGGCKSHFFFRHCLIEWCN